MKPSRPLSFAAAVALGCPLLFAAAEQLAKITPPKFGLDRWTYLLADNVRVPTSKQKGSFGIAFADVSGDGTSGATITARRKKVGPDLRAGLSEIGAYLMTLPVTPAPAPSILRDTSAARARSHRGDS
jgi:hypothetical protein